MIIFFASATVAIAVIVRRQIPLWLASRRLEDAVRQSGSQSSIGEPFWQLEMFFRPKDIFSDSDTTEIRALKQEFFDRWLAARKALPVALAVAIGGSVLCALVNWLGYVWRALQ